jgi:hypothetical protein
MTPSFIRRRINKRREGTANSSGTMLLNDGRPVALDDVLGDKVLRQRFRAFMEQQHCEELLDFWVVASEFETSDLTLPRIAMAHEIFNKFVKPGAEQEISISSKAKTSIEARMQEMMSPGRSGNVKDVFAEARKQVHEVMERDAFRRFQLSAQVDTQPSSEPRVHTPVPGAKSDLHESLLSSNDHSGPFSVQPPLPPGESISRGNAVDLAGALEAKEREHEAAMHVLKEFHKLDLAGALEVKEIEHEAAMHTLREAHKLVLAAVTFEAFSMAVDKVKHTETLTPHNVKPQVTKEQAASPPSSGAPTWTASMWMISSTAVVIRLCERLLVKVPTGASEANKIRQLTKDQIQAVLEDPETVQELVRALMAGIEELNMQDEVDASKLNDKFVADGSGFAFVYGDMVDYHGGLEGASHKPVLLV